jgi:hypothetical protein
MMKCPVINENGGVFRNVVSPCFKTSQNRECPYITRKSLMFSMKAKEAYCVSFEFFYLVISYGNPII